MNPILEKIIKGLVNEFKIERKNDLAFPFVDLIVERFRQPLMDRRRVDFFILLSHKEASIADHYSILKC